ncbi:MAG: methyltransferase domain-containing protein [Deltaproteobacteria bacterium]|jgi:SAM-dependent methyltransferase|nr:methyltransferase domain-containing protein [Deltaproteobacteria bacterium]
MAKREWNPGDLLEISGFFWKTAVLHTAVKLDVFTVIGERQLTCGEISRRLKATQRGVERLLNALVAMELLVKTDGKYANPSSCQTFLSKDSSKYIGHIIMHHHHLVESWSQLDQAVLSGGPVRTRSSTSKEEWRESFLMGMFNLAMGLAPQLVPLIDLSSRKHLLDLGGGPGTYAIHFCQNNPRLRATVYDLPTTRPFAEKTIKQFNLVDRIKFVDGNYITDPIEGQYDVAWLSHILHGEGPQDCRLIIQKAVDALRPQGIIIIHEFILKNSMDGPIFPALFSLNMLLGTEAGQAYSEQQLTDMLAAAGIKNIRRIPAQTPNESGLLLGEN